MNKSSFGEELKALRKRVGMPSKVLSQKVGKAVTYVSQLERELIKIPLIQLVYKYYWSLVLSRKMLKKCSIIMVYSQKRKNRLN